MFLGQETLSQSTFMFITSHNQYEDINTFKIVTMYGGSFVFGGFEIQNFDTINTIQADTIENGQLWSKTDYIKAARGQKWI